jgi:hypothetical protein
VRLLPFNEKRRVVPKRGRAAQLSSIGKPSGCLNADYLFGMMTLAIDAKGAIRPQR